MVSGFASDTAAKCFEYAWQQPRTPWPHMAVRLRLKGLMGATRAYSALRALTKDLKKDSDTVLWNLRVLAVMLGMEQWQGLTVQFAHAADKARARVRPTSPQPSPIECSTVQAFRAAATFVPATVAAASARAPAQARVSGQKRAYEGDVIIVE